MIDLDFEFEGEVWLWTGKGAWHFITLPENISADIKHFTRHRRAGFGSVKVKVTVGQTSWSTSIFPDTQRNAYLLPMKAAIRKAEKINAGDIVAVTLSVSLD